MVTNRTKKNPMDVFWALRHRPILSILLLLCFSLMLALRYYSQPKSVDWCREALINSSDEKSAELEKWKAAETLANDIVPEEISKAIPELLYIIEKEPSALADLCVDALNKLDSKTKEALIPQLAAIVEREEGSNMYSAAPKAMAKMGRNSLSYFLTWLKDSRRYFQRGAIGGLDAMEWQPATSEEKAWYLAGWEKWDEVIKIGEVSQPIIRNRVVMAETQELNYELFRALERSDKTGIPILEDLVWHHPDKNVQHESEKLLMRALEGAEEVSIPILEKLVWRYPNQSVQRESIKILVKALSKKGKVAIPILEELIRLHPDPTVQLESVSVLMDLVEQNREELSRAEGLLSHTSAGVRKEVARRLGSLGEKAAIGPLFVLLDDPESSVRLNAAVALWECGAFNDVKALVVDEFVEMPNMDNSASTIVPPLKYFVIPNSTEWDIVDLLSENLRTSSFSQANILILLQYSVEESSTWYWAGSEGMAKEGTITVKIVDKMKNVLFQKKFIGGILGYSGNLMGGIGYDYYTHTPTGEIASPFNLSQLKAIAANWVNESLSELEIKNSDY